MNRTIATLVIIGAQLAILWFFVGQPLRALADRKAL